LIIRNFEYLLSLNRERHFARAAAACHVSQPTLSAGIKQLEEDMDVLIVKRGRRFEGFTPEGERVLTWAQQMMEDCVRLKQELHGLRDHGVHGLFRLGMLPGTSAVASVLSVAFAERFPKLQISVETGDAKHLQQALRQGELEVILTYFDEPLGEGFDSFALYSERLFLFTPASADDSRRLSWDSLRSFPLCLLRSVVPHATEFQLEQVTRIIHTDSAAVLAAHIETGRWSTVLPQSLAKTLPRMPSLRAVAVSAPEVNAGFVLVRSAPLPAAAHALMEMAHAPELVRSIRAVLAAHKDYLPKSTGKSRKAFR
jgi:DNA-binding transcriptional LysR family regulator